jgi:hypothetical protein
MAHRSDSERTLTAEERDALAHLPSHPIEDYAATLSAVRPIDGGWTWKYRGLKARQIYGTPDSALEAFESCLRDLMERDRRSLEE